jgi:bacillithiol system protein YtxJ
MYLPDDGDRGVRIGAEPLLQMRDDADWLGALTDSRERPVFVMKHSSECGLSAWALAEFENSAQSDSRADYWLLTVQDSPELSAALTQQLHAAHATPQVLLLRHGALAWTASHHRIEVKSLRSAVSRSL